MYNCDQMVRRALLEHYKDNNVETVFVSNAHVPVLNMQLPGCQLNVSVLYDDETWIVTELHQQPC